jgi:hypothetical protein
MRRIKLVVAVLAMLVVMVGSAVPALAQGRGDDHGNHYDRGYDHGQVDYNNYYPGYGYAPYANDNYGNGGLFGPCGLFGTYDPYTGTCY